MGKHSDMLLTVRILAGTNHLNNAFPLTRVFTSFKPVLTNMYQPQV